MTKLSINTYDMDDNEIHGSFEVCTDWLAIYLTEDEILIDDFLEEYNSDDSNTIYCAALLDCNSKLKIIEEWEQSKEIPLQSVIALKCDDCSAEVTNDYEFESTTESGNTYLHDLINPELNSQKERYLWTCDCGGNMAVTKIIGLRRGEAK